MVFFNNNSMYDIFISILLSAFLNSFFKSKALLY